jgi:cytochrome c oxidase subunit 3
MTTVAQDAHSSGDGHGDHEHPKFLAHHFDTPQQQFDSGKLGVWLFLTTEILLFSGLFCAYAVYRANHPEIYAFAHLYLNKWYGALNTIVLIFSSFTMAWAVRASQTNQRKLCVALLGVTIACGAMFMCVKYIEYRDKWRESLLPGEHYNPTEMPGESATAGPAENKEALAAKGRETVAPSENPNPAAGAPAAAAPAADPSNVTNMPAAPTLTTSAAGYRVEQSNIPRAAAGPGGVSADWLAAENTKRAGHKERTEGSEFKGPEPANTHIFFGIYFLMTGLHGIHVLAGMALIAWVMIRANRGDFSAEYFSPVDFVGLYWHIVDLIWIFLFPLLYLIGNKP